MFVRKQLPQHSRLAAAILFGLAVPAAAFAGETAAADSARAEAVALDAQQSGTDAQQAEKANDKATRTLDKIEVTGSRIKRAQVEGPTAVTVITAEDIKKQGVSTIAEVLSTLTQYNGNVVGGEWNSGNQEPDASYINLRGLGVGYQLVLLNGKRIAEYAANSGPTETGVSVGSIPAAAIARIEVLNGGASAIYGSDAVAGVINIITKENWDGNHLRIRGGSTSDGGGDTGQMQFSGGKAWDRGSITYAFEQLNRKPITSGDRLDVLGNPITMHPSNMNNQDHLRYAPVQGALLYNYGEAWSGTLNDGATVGSSPAGDVFWMNQSGGLVGATASGTPDANGALEYSCANAGPNYTPYYQNAAATAPYRCGYEHYYDGTTLFNKYSKTSAYVAGQYRFTDDVEGYGQLLVMHSKDQTAYRSSLYVFNQGDAYDVNLGQFEYSRAIDTATFGGMPQRVWEDTTLSANIGVRGTIADRFDWDTSLTVSRDALKSHWRQLITDRVHTFLFGPAVGTVTESDGSVWPLYDIDPSRLFGPISKSDYDAMTDEIHNDNLSQTSQLQFVFSGPLFSLPAGDVEMAAVVEAAHAHYQLQPDLRSSPDYPNDWNTDHTFNFNAATGGGARDRYGAGVEFRVPVLKSLTATFAERYDKYDDISDIGGATTWEGGLEWRPAESLLIRASHQTSFMAPNIMWIYGNDIKSYAQYQDEYACRRDGLDLATEEGQTACGDAAYSRGFWQTQSGGSGLHEETAKSDGFGFVWDVIDNLSISADYWAIELKGKSVNLGAAEILTGNSNCLMGSDINGKAVDPNSGECAIYAGYVQRDAQGNLTGLTLGAINRAGVRTNGFDASVRYEWEWDSIGRFNVNAGFTRTLGYDERTAAGDPWTDVMHYTSRVAFRERTNWSIGWNKDDWNANLYGFRDGPRVNYLATGFLAPYVQWNAGVSKKITDKMRIGLDVVNVFNNYGPHDPTYTAWPYYQSIYGVMGRAFYANVDIDF